MDTCSCIYVDDYPGPSAFKSVVRTARTKHKCVECGRIIEVGEKYTYDSGIWEDKPNSYKTCNDCYSVREAFFCDGYIYGTVREKLGEHVDEMDGKISSECLMSLTKPARNDVFDMIQECWDELNALEEEEAADGL